MWISVVDSLPREGKCVDVWRRGVGRLPNCICHHKDISHASGTPRADWTQIYGGYAGGATVSHWMEIPDPPEI